MYDPLLRHLIDAPPERLARASLEDVALCAVWFEAQRNAGLPPVPEPALRRMLDAWAQTAEPGEESEGHRQQPLLRELIDLAESGAAGRLARDEADFLVFACGLVQRVRHDGLRERALARLVPHLGALEARRSALPAATHTGNLAARLAVATPGQLRTAEVRDVRIFAGIEAPLRGPLYTHRGHLRIVEGVPEGCSVVVEDGNCIVGGPVLGRAAATHTLEVLDNVAGIAVARRGDLRARQLIKPCVAISKEGSVLCSGAVEPKLVFACQSLFLRHRARGGVYLARTIDAPGGAAGAEFHVSGAMTAGLLEPGEARRTAVVLRRGLGWQDYGESLSQDAHRMMLHAMKHRQRLDALRELEALYARESDEMAGSVLMFLLGEDHTTEQVEKLERLRRRLSYVERIESTARMLSGALDERLTEDGHAAAHPESPAPAFGDEERAELLDMQQDLAALAAEGPIDRDLLERRETALSLGARLFRRMLTRRKALDTLRELAAERDRLAELGRRARAAVDQQECLIEAAMQRRAVLDRARAECKRVEALGQLIAASRGRGDMAGFRDRCGNRYVKLVQRNIEQRLSRAADYRIAVASVYEQLRKARNKLWQDHQVSLPEHVLEGGLTEGASVTAVFAAGVQIMAYKHLLDGGRPGDAGLLLAPDSEGRAVTYLRTPNGAIEPAPTPA